MNCEWKIKKPFIGLYYVPKYQERQAIHRYLEAHHPDVHKTSFSHSTLTKQSEGFWKCPRCQSLVRLILHEDGGFYTYDDRSKKCTTYRCYQQIDLKLCYDDYMEGLYCVRGNVIAFGDFFKSYHNLLLSSDKVPSTEEIAVILKNKPLILLSLGEKFEELRGKRRRTIAEWIDWKIRRKEYSYFLKIK